MALFCLPGLRWKVMRIFISAGVGSGVFVFIGPGISLVAFENVEDIF